MKHKLNKLTIVMFVLAGIAALYSVFALISSIVYIAQMISTGYIAFGESFSDILSYIFGNVGSHVFYTAGFFFFGYILNVIKPGEEIVKDEEDEEEIEVIEIEE